MRCQTLGSGRIIPLIFALGAFAFVSSSAHAQGDEKQTTVHPQAISGPLTRQGSATRPVITMSAPPASAAEMPLAPR